MCKSINAKEKHIEINVFTVEDLFELYMNPKKFFNEEHEKLYEKIFIEIPECELHHNKLYYRHPKHDVWCPFVFRGQANKDWVLETSLYRECNRLGDFKHRRSHAS